MGGINHDDRLALISAIVNQEGTARELAARFNTTTDKLRTFVAENEDALRAAKRRLTEPEEQHSDEVTPAQLDDLWITKKFERLKRLQKVADVQYAMCKRHDLLPAELSTATREFRSYLQLAANELGQLLHRGAGESSDADTLGIDIQGVDMENLR